jgi:hypothetical protein
MGHVNKLNRHDDQTNIPNRRWGRQRPVTSERIAHTIETWNMGREKWVHALIGNLNPRRQREIDDQKEEEKTHLLMTAH